MSVYPGAVDTFTVPGGSATLGGSTPTHTALHTAETGAIVAIQNTLGVNPQGAFASVAARLTAGSGSGLDADLVRGVTPGATGLALLPTATAAAARTVLGLATTDAPTFAGLLAPYLRATTSGGLLLENNTGGDVALFGAGGSQGVTVYGQINGTAIVLGTDPGGSDLLRVGGGVRCGGALRISDGNSIEFDSSAVTGLRLGPAAAPAWVRYNTSGDLEILPRSGYSVVLGTDPGGSELLRVGGKIRATSAKGTLVTLADVIAFLDANFG